jgi:protein O-GlcNAc transferase
VLTLARLGRYEEMLTQLDRLQPEPVVPDIPNDVSPIAAGVPTRHVTVMLTAAWALRDAGRHGESAAVFRRVLEHYPGQPEAQLALLHLYGSREERDEHAAQVAARQEAETDPVRLFEEGSDLLGANDFAGARRLLARAAPLLAGTDYAEAAWFNLAAATFKLEQWDQAVDALDQAIAVNPARAESHHRRGVALYRLERCRQAIPSLQRALELDAAKRDAHAFLALCHTRLGDSAAAARHRALAGN